MVRAHGTWVPPRSREKLTALRARTTLSLRRGLSRPNLGGLGMSRAGPTGITWCGAAETRALDRARRQAPLSRRFLRRQPLEWIVKLRGRKHYALTSAERFLYASRCVAKSTNPTRSHAQPGTLFRVRVGFPNSVGHGSSERRVAVVITGPHRRPFCARIFAFYVPGRSETGCWNKL